MSADLLDDIFVEVTRVTDQRTSNVKGVLETQVGFVTEAEERPLLQLSPLALRVMDVLHPAVVSRSELGSDVLLENDDVGVGNLLRVGGRQDGGSFIMDGVNEDGRRSRQQREEGKAEDALHDG